MLGLPKSVQKRRAALFATPGKQQYVAQFSAAPNNSLPTRTTSLKKNWLRWNFTSERPSRPGLIWAAASLGLADGGKGVAARWPRRPPLQPLRVSKSPLAPPALPRAQDRRRSCPELACQTRERAVLRRAQGSSVWASHAFFFVGKARASLRRATAARLRFVQRTRAYCPRW